MGLHWGKIWFLWFSYVWYSPGWEWLVQKPLKYVSGTGARNHQSVPNQLTQTSWPTGIEQGLGSRAVLSPGWGLTGGDFWLPEWSSQ